ncbi:MAG: alpha/beta fold hydrolase [Lachnospiraceae bacterium]|nr:alpha/beta fold hydrolase [Lachnospiraceae bacterium]
MNKKLTTALLLSTFSVTTIHVINRVHTSLCTVKNLLANSENHYYEWRFGKIRYQKKGSGAPLLLVHDLTVGSSNYEYHRLINNLTEEHEVYSIDLLGYGLSDKPAITYTNNLYEQLISDFIKNVIKRKTSVVVTGESAPFVMMACHNNPDILNKLICINPQNLYLQNQIPSKQTKLMKLFLESPILGTFTYHILTNRHSMEETFRTEYFCHSDEIKEKYIYNYLEAAYTGNYYSKYAFASYVGKYMNMNILHELKEINNSILMIGGEKEKDIKTTIENYKYYNAAIEDVYIPDTKHLPQLEAPDEVLEQIKIFLLS